MKLKDIETTINKADEALEKPIRDAIPEGIASRIAQLNADVTDIKETVDALFTNEQNKVKRATTLLLLRIFTAEIAWIFLVHPIGATAIANGNDFTQRIYDALNKTPLTLILPKQKPEAKPQAQGEIKWTNPLEGGRITSRFDLNREHPVTGEIKEHKGLDISIAPGAPIVAAADGTVVFIHTGCIEGTSDEARSCGGGYGNFIEIDHGNGYSTLYAHLQDVSVAQGQQVKAGQQIGTEGNTGMSTAAHLHFEIRNGLEALDPEKVFPNTWKDWK